MAIFPRPQSRCGHLSRRLGRYLALTVLVSSVAVVHGTGAAYANHYDSIFPAFTNPCPVDRGVCQADGRDHYVYVGFLGPQFQAGVTATLNGSYNTTHLVVHYSNPPTGDTDVIYHYGDVPGPDDAVTRCLSPIDNFRCNQFDVTFDANTLCPCSADFIRAIACHETGHTVGLLHGDNAIPTVSNLTGSLMCMRKPVYDGDYPLGSHNADQIDSVY